MIEDADVLWEDHVVEAVCKHLESHGWTVDSRALATQHGDDIVAHLDEQTLIVEAKGAGSSKVGSKRFGRRFDLGQVKVHVAVAVLRSLAVASAGRSRAGVALPDDELHRRVVGPVLPALAQLEIAVYLVDQRHDVRIVCVEADL